MRITTSFMAMAIGLGIFAPPTSGASGQELFRSADLRIYRAVVRDGGATIVLTNLDEEGNRFGGEVVEASRTSPGAPPPAAASNVVASAGPASAAPGSVAADEPPTVEGRDSAAPGTTIVININVAPPEPVVPDVDARAAYPVVYQVAAPAGHSGRIGDLSNHHFLGYGLDISSPGWFGGLGLNAGNRFGLKTGSSCGHGYDCMFGPR